MALLTVSPVSQAVCGQAEKPAAQPDKMGTRPVACPTDMAACYTFIAQAVRLHYMIRSASGQP